MPDPTGTDLDVLVIGEVLVEISSREPLGERTAATVDFSGDALNVACAAASAGARTACWPGSPTTSWVTRSSPSSGGSGCAPTR